MEQTPHLLNDYAEGVRAFPSSSDLHVRDFQSLRMEQVEIAGRTLDMVYAPFDHVNAAARVVIVGMTPGHHQARNAIRAAQEAFRSGASISEAAARAKVFASFSGEPMRGNLIRMLDRIGVHRMLGLASCGELWGAASGLVHFTSALRYPVFVDGANWSGQPDMVRTPELRRWLEKFTGSELAGMRNALIVPLGPKVSSAMKHLAAQGLIDAAKVLDGLPHPSGANAERIAYFMGDKVAEQCSVKTNTSSIDAARSRLMRQVEDLCK